MLIDIGGALRERLFKLEGESFTRIIALANRLRWRMPIRLEYRPTDRLYVVSDITAEGNTPSSIAFSRKERIWVYAKGVQSRINRLGEVYSLGSCDLGPGDTVIDCGANVGEFSALVRARYGSSVIAVEPESDEARCIPHNAKGICDVVNVALWNETKELNFYSKNRSADSSIFETADYDAITTVQAVRLDDLLDRYGIDRVKLFKLEAEGAEPEILLGATRALLRIEYISADLGPERGLKQEHTIVSVCNHLFGQGFELVSVYPKRQVFLFRNKRIEAEK